MEMQRVSEERPEHAEIKEVALALNEAVPGDAKTSIVISALFYMIRVAMTRIDESKRLELFDNYTRGVRTDIMTDMDGTGVVN